MSSSDPVPMPPRLARSLVRRFLPEGYRDAILGDLQETFVTRCRSRGRLAAGLWYWGQALRMSSGFARERWAPPCDSGPLGDPGQDGSAVVRGSGSIPRPACSVLRGWGTDLRFAVRLALQSPWITVVALLALGAGMAVTIAGFSMVWDSYFAQLPFEHGDRIVAIRAIERPDPDDVPPRLAVFRRWRERQTSFERLAATYRRVWDVDDGEGGVMRYPVAAMTATGFDIAGVPPLLGRTLNVADEEPGARPVVVVGHRVWRTLLGADPGAVGQTLNVAGEDRLVVGVMPEGFRFPVSEDLWVPMRTDAAAWGSVEPRWMRTFGLLEEGVTRERAQAELDAIRAGWAEEHPGDLEVGMRRTDVVAYVEGETEPGTRALFLGMFTFVVMVLLVACASVANLLLARASARTGEIAVRSALGASRGRLVAQLFIEALLLAGGGAAIGLAGAHAGLAWIGGGVSVEMRPFWVDFGVSPPAVAFAVIAAFGAAAVAGIVPALKATGVALNDVLRDEQGTASGVRFGSVSGALTVVEVALSVAFLAAAMLVAESLLVAGDLGRGLAAGEVLVAEITLAEEYGEDDTGRLVVPEGSIAPARWQSVRESLRSAMERVPGVESAIVARGLPGQQHRRTSIELESDSGGEPATGARIPFAEVSPGFFATFDATLLAGRGFRPADTVGAEPVTVINDSFARRFFGEDNPVGERFRPRSGEETSDWTRIVGVVRDLRMNPGAERAAGYYVPIAQRPAPGFTLAVRAGDDPLTLAGTVRETSAEIDPRIDVGGFQTLEEMADGYRVSFEMFSMAFTGLGGTAILLALAGLYAVMSLAVTRRTREIGIRLALGSSRRRVLGVVLRRGLWQVGTGILLGVALGWALLRVVSFLPLGVASGGGLGLVAVCVGVLVTGMAACLVPASRALAIHPVEALRHE